MGIMQFLYQVYNYLRNLEWSERKKENCIFCNEANFKDVVYQDKEIIAVKNIRSAGEEHILILPRRVDSGRHIRDIEALGVEDLPLLKELDRVKNSIIQQSYSHVNASEIHSGYHRGRRPLPFFRQYYWPDIISVHHLHLHLIIRPRLSMRLFKYPAYLRLMWKSDLQVVKEIQRKVTASRRQPLPPDTEGMFRRQNSSGKDTPISIGTRLYRRSTGFQELP